ncbi:GAF domain-containing protein [Oerskovia sp. M15]
MLDAVVAISSNLDLDTVLRRIVEAAMDLTGARYGALGVREGDRLGRFVPVGMDDAQVEAIDHWPEGHGLLGEVIRHPHSLRVEQIEGYPPRRATPPGTRPCTRSWGAHPGPRLHLRQPLPHGQARRCAVHEGRRGGRDGTGRGSGRRRGQRPPLRGRSTCRGARGPRAHRA